MQTQWKTVSKRATPQEVKNGKHSNGRSVTGNAQDKYKSKLDHYLQITKKNPNNSNAHYNIGFIAQRISNPDLARKHYEIAYKLKPNKADYIYSCFDINRSNQEKSLNFLKILLKLTKNNQCEFKKETEHGIKYQIYYEYAKYLYFNKTSKKQVKYFNIALEHTLNNNGKHERDRINVFLCNSYLLFHSYTKAQNCIDEIHASFYNGSPDLQYDKYQQLLEIDFIFGDENKCKKKFKLLQQIVGYTNKKHDINYYIAKMRYYCTFSKDYKTALKWYDKGSKLILMHNGQKGQLMDNKQQFIKNGGQKNNYNNTRNKLGVAKIDRNEFFMREDLQNLLNKHTINVWHKYILFMSGNNNGKNNKIQISLSMEKYEVIIAEQGQYSNALAYGLTLTSVELMKKYKGQKDEGNAERMLKLLALKHKFPFAQYHFGRIICDDRDKYYVLGKQMVTRLMRKYKELPDIKQDGNALKDRLMTKIIQNLKCGYCGKGNKIHSAIYSSYSKLKTCKGCYNEYYCSKHCQKRHWPKHKEKCKKIL